MTTINKITIAIFHLTFLMFGSAFSQTSTIVGHWKFANARSFYNGKEEKTEGKKADLYIDEDGYFANQKKPKRPDETWKRWYDNRKWVKEDTIIRIVRKNDEKTIEKIIIKKLTDTELTIKRSDGKRTVLLSYTKSS